jgi:G3E family GTPase
MNGAVKHSGIYKNIPTTIITGFLGAGKTTSINYLLNNKPCTERWAVLVNEFGRVGVDASLLDPHRGVSIREVSGGCLCCTAGPSFEAALNQLIRLTTPDRILIEPTGIGHPLKIIRTLASGFYRDVLDLKGTITLVDARKLSDNRYCQHPSFQDQLNLADVLVGSKSDCYTAVDRKAFQELADLSVPLKSVVTEITFGQLDLRLLDIDRNESRTPVFPEAHSRKHDPLLLPYDNNSELAEPKQVDSYYWAMLEGRGDGYFTGSWLMGSDFHFQRNALLSLLKALPFERVKGVMQCHDGWLIINGGEGVLDFSSCKPGNSSRLEIIDFAPLHCEALDRQLHAAI